MKRPRLRRPDRHAPYLELLALRLDEPLPLDEEWQLSVHLADCGRCRAAEHEYREQRRQLRGLPDLAPPRDLGARVSAALDREVLRRPSVPADRVPWPAGPGVSRPSTARTSAVISLTVLSVGALALLGGLPLAAPDATRLQPTPLSVPGQPLAYLGAGPDGLALYRTSVDRVCPVSAIDCVDPRNDKPLIALSRPIRPSSLALSPSGERLAISARDTDSEEDLFAIVVMPQPVLAPPIDAPAAPTDAPAVPTDAAPPAPTVTAGAATVPPTIAPTPLLGGSPTITAGESGSGSSSPGAPPPLSPAPAPPTATVSISPAFSVGPTDALPSLGPTDGALTMVAILEDVRGAGAPPAWSADGSILAFSAMPADGRHGPDVYVWRPGDVAAQPITSDHATYFASWAGGHIVASRVTIERAGFDDEGSDDGATPEALPRAIPDVDAGELEVAPDLRASTVLIDPLTAAESAVEGLSVWLPQVDRSRTRAVAWHGRLTVEGSAVAPAEGGLYAFDWSAVDPFVERAAPVGSPSTSPPPPDTSAAPADTASPGPDQTAQPAETSGPEEPTASDGPPETDEPLPTGGSQQSPDLTLPPPPDSAAETAEPTSSPSAAVPDDVDASEPAPTDAAATNVPAPTHPAATHTAPADEPADTPAAAEPVVLTALEPDRDVHAAPVLDWEVRWSPDGTALGYWIGDVPGATWGRLTVLPVDANGQLAIGSPVLPPTLARRSFTLGHDRVAWVAPAEASPEGELRVSAWGPDGAGVLRFSAPDLLGVLAAF